jgi:uncharacterized protein (DUF111 family)
LSRYGDPVHIEDLTADEIIKNVKPLDLIVWNGHVIIILDRKRVIESRPEYETVRKIAPGVRIRPLKEVLEETLQSKNPVDDLGEVSEPGRKNFVIRRWYPF